MAKPLMSDALWQRIEPLLPPSQPRRRHHPGRKPISDRRALTGILFVLKTGINWEDLPAEMGCGCGMTCWRRLQAWTRAGVWPELHAVLLAELEAADKIDWSRALIDTSFVRARGGGDKTGPSPVDRRKKGSKHAVIVDARGAPLAAITTAANVPDVVPTIEVVDAIPPVRGKPGRPRRRPDELFGDRGFDSDPKPAPVASSGDSAADRAAQDGARQRLGRLSLVCGADLVVAAWQRQASGPQGSIPGHPSGVSHSRLREDLFETATLRSFC
jgi:transposase